MRAHASRQKGDEAGVPKRWARTALLVSCLFAAASLPSSAIFSSLPIQPANAHGFRKESFHCYRPFDSLSSFNLAAMRPEDNCRLDYHRVLDAAVRVDCYHNGVHYASGTSGDEKVHGLLSDRFGRLPSPIGVPVANGGSDRPDVMAKNPPDDRSGCYATMLVKSVRDGGFGGRGYATNDAARYAVKLHTRGGGVVHYKGMDGIGYSMCCMFLNQPEHSRCEWKNITVAADVAGDEEHERRLEQVVEHCDIESSSRPTSGGKSEESETSILAEDEDPLGILGSLRTNEAEAVDKKEDNAVMAKGKGTGNHDEEGEDGSSFVGYVTKPLHRNTPGTWTMEVLFYRGHDAVGKVVSDFTVTADMLAPPKHLHKEKDHESGSGESGENRQREARSDDQHAAEGGGEVAAAVAIVPVKDHLEQGDVQPDSNKPKRSRRNRKRSAE